MMLRANGNVCTMFVFCINKLMKNVRGCDCETAQSRWSFPMVKKIKIFCPMRQKGVFIINLLLKIAQPFTARRGRDNARELCTKEKIKTLRHDVM